MHILHIHGIADRPRRTMVMGMKTMMDVARRAGVSQSTVSRVVHGDKRVTERTVAAVKEAMQELGYEPPAPRRRTTASADARAIDGGVIGLVMLDDSMHTHPMMMLAKLRGVERAVQQAGLSLMLTRWQSEAPLPPMLEREDLLGLLLWGQTLDARRERPLASLPRLWLSSHTAQTGTMVLSGNEQAGRLAAEYLLERGVRRPAVLCPLSPDPAYEQRRNGFRFACHVRGCEATVIQAGGQLAEPFAAQDRQAQETVTKALLDKLLETAPAVDGLFLPDDLLTDRLYPMLAQLGLQPETDLQLVSCGNESSYLQSLRPRPATIDLAPETTGRLAVEQLLQLIRQPPGEAPDISIVITPTLIPGTSS